MTDILIFFVDFAVILMVMFMWGFSYLVYRSDNSNPTGGHGYGEMYFIASALTTVILALYLYRLNTGEITL